MRKGVSAWGTVCPPRSQRWSRGPCTTAEAAVIELFRPGLKNGLHGMCPHATQSHGLFCVVATVCVTRVRGPPVSAMPVAAGGQAVPGQQHGLEGAHGAVWGALGCPHPLPTRLRPNRAVRTVDRVPTFLGTVLLSCCIAHDGQPPARPLLPPPPPRLLIVPLATGTPSNWMQRLHGRSPPWYWTPPRSSIPQMLANSVMHVPRYSAMSIWTQGGQPTHFAPTPSQLR
jgi:hypothetical protein